MIFLEKKAGFIVEKSPVIIKDVNGLDFYNTTNMPYVNRFNIPAGIGLELVSGSLIKVNPVKYEIIMPFQERFFYPDASKFEFVFEPNRNGCTIFWDGKFIVFDTKYDGCKVANLFVIYLHEMGHQYYSTEWKADLYAAKKMLDLGFNKSQISHAIIESLSDYNIERQERLTNFLRQCKPIQ